MLAQRWELPEIYSEMSAGFKVHKRGWGLSALEMSGI